jgi:hypothetical protein
MKAPSAEYQQKLVDVLGQYEGGKVNLATARLELQDFLAETGYEPLLGEEGTLDDLGSEERINLVLDTISALDAGYRNWIYIQQAPILDEWPAQELLRAAPSEKPRDWIRRWTDAGGKLYDGRMIALVNDNIWVKISRLGLPYSPFDLGSHMRVRAIDRDTAMKYGLIDRDTQIPPQDFVRYALLHSSVRNTLLFGNLRLLSKEIV